MPEMVEIEDLTGKELDVYARLSEIQLNRFYEPETGIFIAESPKVIKRALDAGYSPLSFLTEKKDADILQETEERRIFAEVMERSKGVPVYTAPREALTELAGFQLTRGLLCAMRRKELPSVEEICKGARRIAVLEQITNPTNVGAIFRSAAALQMDAVLLTYGSSDPLYRRAARVSMGTVFQVPWTFFPKNQWPEQGISLLRSLGFKTAAMALEEDSISVDNKRLRSEKKLAVVLGAEGDGLKESTIANCDYTVKIPMSHGVDSLNVAAASAVAFWELGKGEEMF